MSYADGVPPPTLCRGWLRIAGRLAPPALRQEWRKCWYSRLVNLCILVDRGEVAGRDRAELMLLCSDAMSNAFWLRFNRAGLRYWAQGPQFVMTLAAAGGVLLALLSRGFQATRSIVDAAIEWNIEPRQLRYDPRGDLVVGHVVPLVLALAIGSALVAIGRLSLGRYGWRYWAYLAAKIAAVIVLVPLLWIEGSRWLWNLLTPEVLQGVGSRLRRHIGLPRRVRPGRHLGLRRSAPPLPGVPAPAPAPGDDGFVGQHVRPCHHGVPLRRRPRRFEPGRK